MQNPISLALTCVFVWSLWPTLAKTSKLQPTTITFFMCIVTAITAIALMYCKKGIDFTSTENTTKGMVIIVVAGVLNGIGMVGYGSLLSSGSGFDISKYVVMISSLMPVGTIIFARIILGEQISMQKILSVSLIVIGVYLLQKS